MMRPWTWFLLGIGGIVFCLCTFCLAPFDLAFNLVAGWVLYLARVVPKSRIAWEGLATAAACLVLFGFGLHAFLRWFGAEMGPKDEPARPRWRARWTASLVALVVLMFVSGTAMVGVTHQVGWLLTAKEPFFSANLTAMRRSQSVNNLKQIGLGLHDYHARNGTLPPGATFDPHGRMMHGWQTQILPFIEEEKLYHRVVLDRPWDDATNAAAFKTRVLWYMNPAAPLFDPNEGKDAPSHYAGNVYVLGGDRPRTFDDIRDGLSNTFLAGEAAGEYKPWGHPANWRDPALGINRSPKGFGSPFPGGANLLMADGSVKFVKETIDPRLIRALGTPAGGEAIPGDVFN